MKSENNVRRFASLFNPEESNCLGYILTTITKSQKTEKVILQRQLDIDTGRPINPQDTPVNSLVAVMANYGVSLIPVASLEEAKGKNAVLLWGWHLYRDWYGMCYNDFHVVLKNDDDSYDHKPDGHRPAEVLSSEKIKQMCIEEQPYIFIIG